MLLNPPLPRPQLLEGLLACTPRRPIRVAWCHPCLGSWIPGPGARATQDTQVGGRHFWPTGTSTVHALQVQAEKTGIHTINGEANGQE